MKLIDMKRSKKDREKNCKPMPYTGDMYGYGLRIRLDKEDLEKLGMKVGDFEVGGYFDVTADCCVTSVSQNESADNNSSNVELQIEEMALVADADEKSLKDAVDEGIDEADDS